MSVKVAADVAGKLGLGARNVLTLGGLPGKIRTGLGLPHPVVGLARMGARATRHTAKGAATAAGKAPVETAMAVGTLGLAPSALEAVGMGGKSGSSPARQQAARAMNEQARHFMPTRTASVIDEDTLRSHLAIRRHLEKTAASGRYTVRDAINEAVKAGIKAGRKAEKKSQPKRKRRNKQKFSLFGKSKDAPDYRQYLLAGLALGTAATAAGMGGQALAAGAGKMGEMTHRLGQTRHYNAMLKADPGLRQYNQGEVRQAFNVVHRASPYVAKEPLVAASTVRSIVDAPRADYGSNTPNISLDAMRRVMDVEGSRQGTRYPMFQEVRDARSANIGDAGMLLG